MASPIPRRFLWIAVALLLFSSVCNHVQSSGNDLKTAIESLPYRQEITVPLDTSLEITWNQPIDIRVTFTNPCWAQNETRNSVRVGMDDGTGLQEIESQIYDLGHSDETHITACSVVFLIPDGVNGKEKYYVLYDSKETTAANYPKHVTVEDTHYFYEPIPGQTIDFDYYGIRQEGFVIYAVVQKGQLLGNPVALSAIKFKPNSTAVETYNLDQLGNFDFRVGIPGEPDYVGSSWATDTKKTVLVDGNLMARVRLECISPRGDIHSDNIYTYYYSPTNAKRISVDAQHEILKTITIEDPSTIDGDYASITSIKSRSASIEKMNVGDILPTVYIYTKDGTIQEFSVPQSPESTQKELVLSAQDAMTLGTKGWVCLADPKSGKAHGMIFNATTGIVNGPEDGVQIKVYAKQNIKLPGLEADTGNVECTRKTYENGNHLTVVDQGRTYRYKVEFLTLEQGDYSRIDNESTVYQRLIKDVPVFRGNVTGGEAKKERYALMVYTHLARSVPLGSLLSAALGKNISYIYAELYQGNSFRSSGTVGRLSLGAISLNMTGKNFREKLQTILGIFDWRNLSLFKKIRFPDLDPGMYVVKIYRENPRFAKERQFIGFGIVNLSQDTVLRISCRPQGSIAISLMDQEGKGVENAHCLLQAENTTIVEAISDADGRVRLSAPCYPLKPYELQIQYQGFLIEEKPVKLNLFRRFLDMKESVSLKRYSLSLQVTDTWGFAPAIDVNPTVVSTGMATATTLRGMSTQAGAYVFNDLLPASYQLSLSYKAFKLQENFTLEKATRLDVKFPAEFTLDFSVYNSFADPLSSGEVSLQRNGKTLSMPIRENGTASLEVPPGDYEVFVHTDAEEIARQQIQVRGEKTLDLVTTQGSLLHLLIIALSLVLVIGTLVFMGWKRRFSSGIKLVVIGLLLIALGSPWWVLSGANASVETTTNTLVIPPQIVTLTKSSEAIGGEISAVPAEVTMVLGLLALLVGVTCGSIVISLLIRRFRRTTLIVSFLSLVLVILTLGVFYYAFSQVTQVGVGSFLGSRTLDVSIPGEVEQVAIPCSWGPGVGFYLLVLSMVLLILTFFMRRIEGRLTRK